MLATLRGLYRRPRTLFRHQSWAIRHLGMHRFGSEDAITAAQILTAETNLYRNLRSPTLRPNTQDSF